MISYLKNLLRLVLVLDTFAKAKTRTDAEKQK
jgi:hypothetical protein